MCLCKNEFSLWNLVKLSMLYLELEIKLSVSSIFLNLLISMKQVVGVDQWMGIAIFPMSEDSQSITLANVIKLSSLFYNNFL